MNTRAPPHRIVTANFIAITATQAVYGLAWSTFLLTPRFLGEALHASAEEIGRISAMSAVAGVVGVPLVGVALDRWGRRPVVTLGAALCAIHSVAYVGVTEIGVAVYLLPMLLGLSFLMVFNGAATMVVDQTPPEHLGRALGWFSAANVATNAVAPAATEALLGVYGWSVVFVAAAGLAVAATALSRSTMEPQRRDGPAIPGPSDVGAGLIRMAVACAGMGASFGTVLVFFQPYALASGVEDLSPYFLGFTLAAVGVRLGCGGLSDRLGAFRVARITLVSYGLVAALAGVLVVGHLFWLGLLMGASHGILYPALTAASVQGLAPHRRGRALAYVTGGFMFGHAMASMSLGGVAERWGFPWTFVLGGACAVAASFALRDRRGPL